MLLTQLHCRMRKARHIVVGCMLFALAVYGFSTTIVQLLGATHIHRQTAVSADPMAGWVDIRRIPYVARTTVSLGHTHTRSLFERHHHDVADETVLALEGPVTEGAAGDAGSSSTGSATLVLFVASQLLIDPAGSVELKWRTAPADSFPSRHRERLERPPNAS